MLQIQSWNLIKLKFHSPIKRSILQRHITSFASKLIRSSIKHFRYQQTKFSKELPSLTHRLQFLCHTRDSYFDLRQKIHELNQTLYNFLKTMKDKKMKELIKDQKQDIIYANQAISTPINNINPSFTKGGGGGRLPPKVFIQKLLIKIT